MGLWAACLLHGPALATSYPLPREEFDLVGYTRVVEARREDTLLDIARRYGVGQEAILMANPGVDRWLPGAGTRVIVPSRHILPAEPFEGIVLNLPEMRLYYYPKPEPGSRGEVLTFPVGVGRMEWETPLGETRLVSKEKDPAWRPPESIRREHAAAGDPLPRYVPPGPDNPLGRHALRLGMPGYLIHGTNKVFGVGMRVSHGCVRMLPEDVELLFELAPVGETVRIINEPAKVGWYGGQLYLEMHPPLEENPEGEADLYERVMAAVDAKLFQRPVELDEDVIRRAVARPTGMPVVISAGR